MARKLKRWLPNIFIVLGAAFVLVWAVYSAVNYPWKTLFAKWGWIEYSDQLPDPAPLPDSARDPAGIPGGSGGAGMPEQPGSLSLRPAMNLTKLGVIKIPRLQLSENIVYGGGDELYYGVGMVPGTAYPGQVGNCVLAGHRSYIWMRPFRYLNLMEAGDQVYLTDEENRYTYEVYKVFEVEPDEGWVMRLQDGEESMLTLITCTPVMIHSQRLIVWCRLIDTVALEQDA